MDSTSSSLKLAIHKLRASTQGPVQAELAAHEIPASPMADQLVERFSALYAAKSSKGFGRFEEDEASFPLPGLLRQYVRDQSLDFFALSRQLMQLLVSQIGEETLAGDHHVLFARVQHGESVDFLFVGLIPEARGIALGSDTGLSTSPYLDLDGMRLAGRIDLVAWQHDNASRYLSFLKGRGDVADYFKRFLACNDVVGALKETQKLIKGIEQFAEAEQLAPEARGQLFEEAHRYLEELGDNEQPWHVEAVASQLCPAAPEALSTALRSEELALREGCIPDRRAIRPLLKLKAAAPNWKLEFNRSGLRSGDVVYDRSHDRIVLSNIPEELRRALELESGS